MKFYDSEIEIDSKLWETILLDTKIITQEVLDIFLYLYQSKNFEAAGGEIARELGYVHHALLNRKIPDFSKKVLAQFPHIQPPKREDGRIRYWHIPFLGTEGTGKFTWILRPELVDALTFYQTREDNFDVIAEESPSFEPTFQEGHSIKILVNKYERNPQARILCLEQFGYKCLACEFDFERVYGSLGGMIPQSHRPNW
jgi:5-methylcytosine-specific restriction enzyme A